MFSLNVEFNLQSPTRIVYLTQFISFDHLNMLTVAKSYKRTTLAEYGYKL